MSLTLIASVNKLLIIIIIIMRVVDPKMVQVEWRTPVVTVFIIFGGGGGGGKLKAQHVAVLGYIRKWVLLW